MSYASRSHPEDHWSIDDPTPDRAARATFGAKVKASGDKSREKSPRAVTGSPEEIQARFAQMHAAIEDAR
jgi:hypothetical protein